MKLKEHQIALSVEQQIENLKQNKLIIEDEESGRNHRHAAEKEIERGTAGQWKFYTNKQGGGWF